ncbi:MAG: Dam family site-specific DNA-(adenine-N6)-methyltransferase [Synergistaceae bacterium]|jgi:adenine-specific DNA-methyltransferase|nr:Dam family site-specific DNA-(adenine-N6)-methyltransferase [Synergistaceae bacterium]
MRYIGGKSQLLGDIEAVINKNASGRESVFCDIFSGTGSVARYFKPRYEVHSNDILHFSYVIQKATIENNAKPLFDKLAKIGIDNPLKFLEETDITEHCLFFVTENYAPSEHCERKYISRHNAVRVDFIRNTIEEWKQSGLIDEKEYYYLLASLIEGVPYISNTTGTYGAYLKNWDKRALRAFEMARLDVIDNGRANHSYNADANALIREIEGDILYIDPPYNARQYAPNYHLLETISRYDNPEIHGVTGMRPYDDMKSAFCVKSEVLDVFEDLVVKAKFSNIVMSYSTDGLMTSGQIESILKRHGVEGSYKRYDIPYRKYKSKITDETKTVREYIFYVHKDIPRSSASLPAQPKSHTAPQAKRTKYLKSPLNYIGGKYKLLPQILPLFPRQIGTFVDLFAGGCNVGINVNAERIVCNDLNTKIIDMFRVFQQTDSSEILARIESNIREYCLSKENEQGFIAFRDHYNRTGDPIDLYTLTCYSFNYQFRFNNNLEYNNPFGRSRSQFSENMRNSLLSFLERINAGNIEFLSTDFERFDFSSLGYEDMVYCDPPYLITTGSYNDGNRGFKDWKETQETALYALLDKLHRQGVRFALSNVLTHKDVRNEILINWRKKYVVTQISNDYSNSCYNAAKGESTEVLITNY